MQQNTGLGTCTKGCVDVTLTASTGLAGAGQPAVAAVQLAAGGHGAGGGCQAQQADAGLAGAAARPSGTHGAAVGFASAGGWSSVSLSSFGRSGLPPMQILPVAGGGFAHLSSMHAQHAVTPSSCAADTHACCRNLQQDRVPFQYLIATAHWRDLVLAVGPGILVPRPETELMLDLAAAALQADPSLGQLAWADLGTGSGALAIGTAQLLQTQQGNTPQVYAVDLSPTAAAYAAANAAACGVQDTVHALQGSWFEPLQHLKGRLGGVLSNPPYIPRSQIEAGLQAEVGQHEPMSALDGGPGEGMDSLQVGVAVLCGCWHALHTGLSVCLLACLLLTALLLLLLLPAQVICEQAVDMLAPGGFLALEVSSEVLHVLTPSPALWSPQMTCSLAVPACCQTAGAEQAPLVQQLLQSLREPGAGSSCAFTNVTIHEDCYGVPRFVSATRSSVG